MPTNASFKGRALGILMVFVLGLVVSGQADAGLIESTFDTDAEGWTLSGDSTSPTPDFVSSGGNPGGHIRGTDAKLGPFWFFDAPAKFLGAQADKTRLSFDLNQTGAGGPSSEIGDVTLIGGGLQIVVDAGPNPLPKGDWISFSVLLDSSAPWQLNDLAGAFATQSQIQAVLASLAEFRIRGEFQNSSGIPGDVGRLDNVRLTGGMAIPEPASLALFGFALICLAFPLCRRGLRAPAR